jgi:hypothetical protein
VHSPTGPEQTAAPVLLKAVVEHSERISGSP